MFSRFQMPFFIVTSVCTSACGPSKLESEPIIEGLRATIQSMSSRPA